jgi:hypothetical protein
MVPNLLDLGKSFLDYYNVKTMKVSAYNPQSDGLVERGHAPLVKVLSKSKKLLKPISSLGLYKLIAFPFDVRLATPLSI